MATPTPRTPPDHLSAAGASLTPRPDRVRDVGDPNNDSDWAVTVDPEDDALQVAYLRNRGVGPFIAEARGYKLINDTNDWSVGSGPQRTQFRFNNDFDQRLDGISVFRPLGIPLYSVAHRDAPVCIQLRPRDPWVIKNAKGDDESVLKFIAPAGIKRGSRVGELPADVHPEAHDWALDSSIPMLITEGAVKGDAVLTATWREGIEIAPVSLTGVTMGYRGAGTSENPGLRPQLVEETLGQLPLERLIFLAWDSDWRRKPGVYNSMLTMTTLLEERGAQVFVVDVPSIAGSGTGIDDYLANAWLDQVPQPLTDLLAAALPAEVARAIVREFTDDDAGRGERLAIEMLRTGSHRASSTTGGFLRWTGTHWQNDDNNTVERLALELTDRIIDDKARTAARSRRAIQDAVRVAASYPGVSVSNSELDQDPFLLNTQNGTVDLRSGEMHPHRPEDLITSVTSCGYNPTATSRTWDRFLLETFLGNEQSVRFLQRFIGMSAIGRISEEIMGFFVGFGRNGKSVCTESIKSVLGTGYAGTLPPDALIEGRARDEHLIALRNKRFVTSAETKKGQALDEAMMKRMTSRDTVSARDLCEKRCTFPLIHTLFIATNYIPAITAQDEGTWRRIRIIPFENRVSESDEDPDLPLTLQAEAEGILRWIIEGARAYIDSGSRLGTCDAVQRATADFRQHSDLLGAFLEEECVTGSNVRGKRSKVYEAFQSFSIGQGRRPWSQKALVEALQERKILAHGEGHKRKIGGEYYWLGIGLRSKREVEPADE